MDFKSIFYFLFFTLSFFFFMFFFLHFSFKFLGQLGPKTIVPKLFGTKHNVKEMLSELLESMETCCEGHLSSRPRESVKIEKKNMNFLFFQK